MNRIVHTAALTALFPLLAAGTADANDTTAELAAGGIVFVRDYDVEMASEDLFLSRQEVRVDYVFHNGSDHDVTSLIAFPMPDIEGSEDFSVSVPNPTSDNFMDFSATVEGQPIETNVDRHAFASEVDVTDLLTRAGIPLLPYGDATDAALGKLPQETLDDFATRGMIIIERYEDSEGAKTDVVPVWRLKTTYWWRTTFPAGRDLHVAHRYHPGVGATTGVNFVNYGDGPRFEGPIFDEESRKYCFDDGFLKAVGRRYDAAPSDSTPLVQSWLSYVLTTGQNWSGSIGRFHLTVDKGSPDALVSFCGDGVRKTGPTTFELTAQDFYPEKDIDVVFLSKPEW